MMPAFYAAGDGPHIQPVGPAQPLPIPHRPASHGPTSDNDAENTFAYKLIFLLTATVIMLSGVTIFICAYHLSMEDCGISTPTKSQVSVSSSVESTTFIWYLVFWSPLFPSPIIRPCSMTPSASTSAQSIWASCLPAGLHAKVTVLNKVVDCLNPLYAREHEAFCRGKEDIFLNPLYGVATLVPIPTPIAMGNREGRGDFRGPQLVQSLLHYMAQMASQEFPERKRKNKIV
ncbi:uncharacterized protein [Dipodomys merriami]|uniref:uncharacterized protein n=1 Tax=Dipodomys merriami TaxID=94247 RepID=UPI003855860D